MADFIMILNAVSNLGTMGFLFFLTVLQVQDRRRKQRAAGLVMGTRAARRALRNAGPPPSG